MYEMFYVALSYDAAGVVAVLQQFDTFTYDEKIDMYILFFNYVEMFVDSFSTVNDSLTDSPSTALESLRKTKKPYNLDIKNLKA